MHFFREQPPILSLTYLGQLPIKTTLNSILEITGNNKDPKVLTVETFFRKNHFDYFAPTNLFVIWSTYHFELLFQYDNVSLHHVGRQAEEIRSSDHIIINKHSPIYLFSSLDEKLCNEQRKLKPRTREGCDPSTSSLANRPFQLQRWYHHRLTDTLRYYLHGFHPTLSLPGFKSASLQPRQAARRLGSAWSIFRHVPIQLQRLLLPCALHRPRDPRFCSTVYPYLSRIRIGLRFRPRFHRSGDERTANERPENLPTRRFDPKEPKPLQTNLENLFGKERFGRRGQILPTLEACLSFNGEWTETSEGRERRKKFKRGTHLKSPPGDRLFPVDRCSPYRLPAPTLPNSVWAPFRL